MKSYDYSDDDEYLPSLWYDIAVRNHGRTRKPAFLGGALVVCQCGYPLGNEGDRESVERNLKQYRFAKLAFHDVWDDEPAAVPNKLVKVVYRDRYMTRKPNQVGLHLKGDLENAARMVGELPTDVKEVALSMLPMWEGSAGGLLDMARALTAV